MAGPLTRIARSTTVAFLLLAGALVRLPAQHDSIPQARSPHTALLLSLGATVIPFAIGSASSTRSETEKLAFWGILVGPAVGHFYAGHSKQAWQGIGIRSGVGVATLAVGFASCSGRGSGSDSWDCGSAAVIIGSVALLASVVHDIATAPRSAREYNASHPRPVSLIVVPLNDGAKTRMGVGLHIGM